MESIGSRIFRLRLAKGWSRPELGRRMAAAIAREEPFSGELIRQYELSKTSPGKDARRALAAVLDKPEPYIEFGPQEGEKTTFPERFEYLRNGMPFEELSEAIFDKTGSVLSVDELVALARGGIEPNAYMTDALCDFFEVRAGWFVFGPQNFTATLDDLFDELSTDSQQQVLDFLKYMIAREEEDVFLNDYKDFVPYKKLLWKLEEDVKRFNAKVQEAQAPKKDPPNTT